MTKTNTSLSKKQKYYVVRANTEEQALEDYTCRLHSIYSQGNSFIYFREPIEAAHSWEAKSIFDEKLHKGERE